MSAKRDSSQNRLAGKWQIPLFFVAAVLLAGSWLTRRKEAPVVPTVGERLSELEQAAGKEPSRKIISQANEILRSEGVSEPDRAFAQLQLARARHSEAVKANKFTPDRGRQIIETYGQAAAVKDNLTAEDYLRIGQAHEWRREFAEAIARFDEAVLRGIDGEDELRKKAILLREEHLSVQPDESLEHISKFLNDIDPHRHDLLLWGIERKLDLLEVLDRLVQAEAFLATYRESFEKSDLRDRFDYLDCLVLFKNRQFDEAERRLRALQSRVQGDDETYARAGWLLGCTIMNDGSPQRPEEALSFFADALTHQPDGPGALACRYGQAEALAMLERHEAAIEVFRSVVDELQTITEQGPTNRGVVRGSLSLLSDSERQSGN
jgi:tetratricopeptide (TPR) repeat protein